MEKMTNKKALEFVLGLDQVKANTEVAEKLEKMLAQVVKKNSSVAEGKMTKTQEENEKVKEVILTVLARAEQPQQIKELLATDELREYTNQKLSALLKQLIEANKVARVEEKRVARFKLA